MSYINDKIRQIAKETEPELIHIRRELHQYPELGIDLPKTHELISRELIISRFRQVAAEKGVNIAASYWGKVKTVVQMIMSILLIIHF